MTPPPFILPPRLNLPSSRHRSHLAFVEDLGKAVLQRPSSDVQTVVLVGRLGQAHDARLLGNSLSKF